MTTSVESALRALNFEGIREAQKAPLEAILRGEDALVVMPTGGGKSALYQIPGLCRDGLTLVISPLIALMADQVQALRNKGIPVVTLHSRQTTTEIRGAWTTITGRRYDGWNGFVYSSPEALTDERIETLVSSGGVSMLAVDEAHCISEWGHEFRPSYRRLLEIRKALGNPQAIAVTATATKAVRTDIVANLGLRGKVFVGKFDRPNIALSAYETLPKDRPARAAEILRDDPQKGSALVYCRSRREANLCAGILLDRGISAASYHAGLRPDVQEQAQEAWTKGKIRVMVATTAFGMGIDKPDVRTIIHLGCQLSLEDYYQQIGRAGRDGKPSRAVLLWGESDGVILQMLARGSTPRAEDLAEVWDWVRTKKGLDAGMNQIAQMYRSERPSDEEEFELGAAALSRIFSLLAFDGLIIKTDAIDRPLEITVSNSPPDLKLRGRPSQVWSVLARRAFERSIPEFEIDRRALATESGVSVSHVLPALKSLEEKGLLRYKSHRTNSMEVIAPNGQVSAKMVAYVRERFALVQRRIDDSLLYPHAGSDHPDGDRMLRSYILDYFGSTQ